MDSASQPRDFADAVGIQLEVRHDLSVWGTKRVAAWLERHELPAHTLASSGRSEATSDLASDGVDAVVTCVMEDSTPLHGPSWRLWVVSTRTGEIIGSAYSSVEGGWTCPADTPEPPEEGAWEHSVALADALAEMFTSVGK